MMHEHKWVWVLIPIGGIGFSVSINLWSPIIVGASPWYAQVVMVGSACLIFVGVIGYISSVRW